MARRFRGEWVHKVDQKGRVSVPAPFRRALEEGDPDWNPESAPNLVLIFGFSAQPFIEGYTMRAIEELDDMIADLPRFSPERESLERMLQTKSLQTQIDENGRIVLPARLREQFAIGDEAMFAGRGETFQIWSNESYAARESEFAAEMAQPGRERELLAMLDKRRRESAS